MLKVSAAELEDFLIEGYCVYTDNGEIVLSYNVQDERNVMLEGLPLIENAMLNSRDIVLYSTGFEGSELFILKDTSINIDAYSIEDMERMLE